MILTDVHPLLGRSARIAAPFSHLMHALRLCGLIVVSARARSHFAICFATTLLWIFPFSVVPADSSISSALVPFLTPPADGGRARLPLPLFPGLEFRSVPFFRPALFPTYLLPAFSYSLACLRSTAHAPFLLRFSSFFANLPFALTAPSLVFNLLRPPL